MIPKSTFGGPGSANWATSTPANQGAGRGFPPAPGGPGMMPYRGPPQQQQGVGLMPAAPGRPVMPNNAVGAPPRPLDAPNQFPLQQQQQIYAPKRPAPIPAGPAPARPVAGADPAHPSAIASVQPPQQQIQQQLPQRVPFQYPQRQPLGSAPVRPMQNQPAAMAMPLPQRPPLPAATNNPLPQGPPSTLGAAGRGVGPLAAAPVPKGPPPPVQQQQQQVGPPTGVGRGAPLTRPPMMQNAAPAAAPPPVRPQGQLQNPPAPLRPIMQLQGPRAAPLGAGASLPPAPPPQPQQYHQHQAAPAPLAVPDQTQQSMSTSYSIDESAAVANFPTLDVNEPSFYVKRDPAVAPHPHPQPPPPQQQQQIPPVRAIQQQQHPPPTTVTSVTARPGPVVAPAPTVAVATPRIPFQAPAPPQNSLDSTGNLVLIENLQKEIGKRQAEIANLRNQNRSQELEINRLRIDNDRLSHRLRDLDKFDAQQRELQAAKAELSALKASAPFARNDSDERDETIVRMRREIANLKSQLSSGNGNIISFPSSQPAMSASQQQLQQAKQPQKISIPYSSPQKIAPIGSTGRNTTIESPPPKGPNNKPESPPEAASSGVPAPNPAEEVLVAEKEPEYRFVKVKRKRQPSASAAESPATAAEAAVHSASKRRRIISSEDISFDALPESQLKQEELESLSRKLIWPRGPAVRLLSLADESFLRLQQSFQAHQKQAKKPDAIQFPEYLQGVSPVKMIQDGIAAVARQERSAMSLIPDVHKLLFTPRLILIADALTHSSSNQGAQAGIESPMTAAKRRVSSKEILRSSSGVSFVRRGALPASAAPADDMPAPAAAEAGNAPSRPPSRLDPITSARMATSIMDLFEDEVLPPEAATVAEEENAFMILKHEAGFALLETLLSSSVDCRRFMLGRINLSETVDALAWGQSRLQAPLAPVSPRDAPSSSSSTNPRFVRRKAAPQSADPAAAPAAPRRADTMPVVSSAYKDHPGVKLLEYIIELLPICRRISTLTQRVLTVIHMLAREASEPELSQFFSALAIRGNNTKTPPILECISCSLTLEVCNLAIETCMELIRCRPLYDSLMSSSWLWERIYKFFIPKAQDDAIRVKKKEIEVHQHIVAALGVDLHRALGNIEAQLRQIRTSCIRFFSLLLTIYNDSALYFMALAKRAPMLGSSKSIKVDTIRKSSDEPVIQIDQDKVVSLISAFINTLSDEVSRVMAFNANVTASTSSSQSSPLSGGVAQYTASAPQSSYQASVGLVRELIQWLRLFSNAAEETLFARVLKPVKHTGWAVAMELQKLVQQPPFQRDVVLAENLSFLIATLKRTEEMRAHS